MRHPDADEPQTDLSREKFKDTGMKHLITTLNNNQKWLTGRPFDPEMKNFSFRINVTITDLDKLLESDFERTGNFVKNGGRKGKGRKPKTEDQKESEKLVKFKNKMTKREMEIKMPVKRSLKPQKHKKNVEVAKDTGNTILGEFDDFGDDMFEFDSQYSKNDLDDFTIIS